MAENIRPINAVKGTVYDLGHALSLPSDDCKVLVVSSRTLYFIQAFSRGEIAFLSRYARELLGGDQYVIADSQAEIDQIDEIVNRYGLEVIDMTCDIVQAIEGLKLALTINACGCPVGEGQDTDDGERGGDVPAPIGDIVYQEPAVLPDRDCKAANLVYDTLHDLFAELNKFNVDDMAVYGLQFTVGIVAAAIAVTVTAPLLSLVVAVAGLVAVFSARLIGTTVSLQNMVDSMEASHQDLVCILYNSTLASTARADFLVQFEAAGGTALESALLEVFMTNALMDTLYFDTPDLAAFWPTYTGAIDCLACAPALGTDWIIMPEEISLYLATTATGLYGSGLIDQTLGEQWTITAEERTDAPGNWLVGLVVRHYWDNLATPKAVGGGPITALPGDGLESHSKTGTPPNQSYGGRMDVCAGVIDYTPPGTTIPNTYARYGYMTFQAPGPFTVTFSIRETPIICP